jgi:molybdenum cofactor biosynthesis protein B
MRSREFKPIRIALLTLSDTRTLENDTSGDILAQRIADKGHVLATRKILREDVPTLVSQLDAWIDDPEIDCIISTGGTGLTGAM